MNSSTLSYLTGLPRFEYFEPGTIEEACTLLNEYQDTARLLAGGTDILISMKTRETAPRHLINIKKIPGLNYIRHDDGDILVIGPTTPLSDIENSDLVKDKNPLVAEAVGKIGSPSIRNIATMAGNICNALPSADSAPTLLCLGAEIKTQWINGSGEKSERIIPIEDFFAGPRQTVLKRNEILKEIRIPSLASKSKGAYIKFSQKTSMDLAIVGVAVLIQAEGGICNVCNDIKIALGAVAPTPIRAKNSEGILLKNELNTANIHRAANAAAQEASPITDHRASQQYRRDMIERLVTLAINRLIG